MAEVVLGAVASGITVGALVAQVTSSVVKLKSYWDQVQDAPREIQDLLEEVEILRLILTAIEDNQRRKLASMSDPLHMLMCLRRCKEEVVRLEDLTESLNTHLDAKSTVKRKWASTKVVLKKEMLEQYRMRVERATSLLSVSQLTYSIALHHLQPHTIVAQSSRATNHPTALTFENFSPKLASISDDHTTEKTNPPEVRGQTRDIMVQSWIIDNFFGTIRYSKTRYNISRKKLLTKVGRQVECEKVVVEYRAPAWLISRAWRLQAVNSCIGWTFCPRMYNIVSTDSPVFRVSREGEAFHLRTLFEKQECSPFDHDELGCSPLFYAATVGNYAICQLLIELGADPNENIAMHGSQRTAVDQAVWGCWTRPEMPVPNESRLNIIRLLLQHYDIEYNLGRYIGPTKGFMLCQQIIDPAHYAKPLKERVEIAIEIASKLNEPETVRASIALGPLPPLTHTIRNDVGDSLLHAVAFQIGFTLKSIETRDVRYFGSKKLESNLIGWRLLRKELIAQGSQLHCVSESQTPFLALISGLMKVPNPRHKQIQQILGLADCLEDLQDADIDLADYGSKETDLYQKGCVSWGRMGIELEETTMRSEYQWTLRCLDYGPSTSDWKVTIDRLSDPRAHLSRNVPGGWVDDDEDDHEEADED